MADVPASFSALRSMTCAKLAQLGCRRWDDSGLMLFPASWFDSIPPGYELVSINGETLLFTKTLSRDRRWGVLAFGIIGREPHHRSESDG